MAKDPEDLKNSPESKNSPKLRRSAGFRIGNKPQQHNHQADSIHLELPSFSQSQPSFSASSLSLATSLAFSSSPEILSRLGNISPDREEDIFPPQAGEQINPISQLIEHQRQADPSPLPPRPVVDADGSDYYIPPQRTTSEKSRENEQNDEEQKGNNSMRKSFSAPILPRQVLSQVLAAGPSSSSVEAVQKPGSGLGGRTDIGHL